jgi:AraC-like DNA-binding protein
MARSIAQHQEAGLWEMWTATPHDSLRPYITLYCGYQELVAAGRRMEVPHPNVVLVIGLGPALRVVDPRRPADGTIERLAFTAGIHDAPVFTESSQPTRGLQINLTPIGARLLFRVPMDSLANRVVALDDIFGAEARRLTERLQEAPAWTRCFDILDEVIGKRVTSARAPNALVVRASHVLRATRGAASIARLARDLECSQRHLIAMFREEVGVTPKTYARIVRFDHAVKQLRGAEGVRWAEIADASGYYDQAHLIRDFHQFAGLTPGEFLAR